MAEPNATQRSDWNGAIGQRWVTDADRRDRVLQPILEALLTAARIQPSEDVLDIGCGCGASTLAAARLTAGTITGVDISEPMLGLARQRSGGHENVAFVHGDAQTFVAERSVDVAISRFGTMFFDDPVAAFTSIASHVRPSGRLCIATWQALEANEWLQVPRTALLEYSDAPPLDQQGPGMLSQADPAVIIAIVSSAGWTDVNVEQHQPVLTLGMDTDDAVDYLAGTGVVRRHLDAIQPDRQAKALAAIATVVGDHMDDGVKLSSGINITTAISGN
jgi:SAM-dependent methyltransferase